MKEKEELFEEFSGKFWEMVQALRLAIKFCFRLLSFRKQIIPLQVS